jgi:hypothetical protein
MVYWNVPGKIDWSHNESCAITSRRAGLGLGTAHAHGFNTIQQTKKTNDSVW